MKYVYFISYAVNMENGCVSFDNRIFSLNHEITTSKDIRNVEDTIKNKLKYASSNFYIKVFNFILLRTEDSDNQIVKTDVEKSDDE